MDADLLVNVVTPRTQTSHIVGTAIDLNEAGSSVIVFSGKGLHDDQGVFYRRFPKGQSPSEVVQVNQTTRENQMEPGVAIDDEGRFVVVWSGRGRDPRGRSDQNGIFARWYDHVGAPRTSETLINTTIGGIQKQPDVAMAPNGRSVIVWTGSGPGDVDGVFAQRLDPHGIPIGGEHRINQYTRGEQSAPTVAMADDGSYVVSWSSRHQDGSGWGIYYRQYNPDGIPIGDEKVASEVRVESQFRSRIASDRYGNFAIVWAGYSSQSSWDVYLRRFDRYGIPFAPEVLVNRDVVGHQQDPDIAMSPEGNFVISWTSGQPTASGQGSGSGWEVYGKLFDSRGNEVSPETPLSPHQGSNSGHQQFPAVAIGSGPGIIASWSGRGLSDHGGVWVRQPSFGLRPIFPGISPVQIPEEELLILPLTAYPAFEGQRIGFRLDPSDHPDGMVVDPRAPRLLWNPTEEDGPGTFHATLIAYDLENPSRSTSQRMVLSVLETNRAPWISPIADRTIDEFESITILPRAHDPDRPNNRLQFSLVAPPDPGMMIDATTGRFTWQTNDAHAVRDSVGSGQSPYRVTIQVTDDGSPSRSATQSFTIHVRDVDQEPVLIDLVDHSIREREHHRIRIEAIDPDDSDPTWNFRMVGPIPDGLSLDPATGILEWSPTEIQGPEAYPIAIEVENLKQPGRISEGTLVLNVLEVNEPPQFQSLENLATRIGMPVSVNAMAIDPDLPHNRIFYSIVESSDPSAIIDPVTGRFQWTPKENGSFRFTLQASDGGTPSLSDRESFFVTVGDEKGPPILRPQPVHFVDEWDTLRFQVIADPSRTDQRVWYRLESSPEGMTLDAHSGQIQWTPNESMAPSQTELVVRAFDADHPELFDEISIDVIAREVNAAPNLPMFEPIIVREGDRIEFPVVAWDDDLPSNRLSYEIVGDSPTGMSLLPVDHRRARLQWEPTEADGPTRLSVVLKVTDNGIPSLSHLQTVSLTVLEENQAPILQPIPDFTIDEEVPWSYAVLASDSDQPPQAIQYALSTSLQSKACGSMRTVERSIGLQVKWMDRRRLSRRYPPWTMLLESV